ncbi:alpha/beta hydrolase-fold protein [Hymenobacter sp. M29]|uniref:Alpha/beta hydrolase-fold protein n=1 Tax=Hymenobacter mellowenesis TaxID=3063995 RepID=A0ABT9AC94_9BACT|nr:alpha/beta hydrolase-fold protein [Hymenobacter sp. M29]MDO7847158.1 alpha/beta hydrolase-fold protein [Hymenobacter sp. M29]
MLALAGVSDTQGQAVRPAAAAPLVIGQTFTLPSKALGETRRINVYLPDAYTDSATRRLPVLYMPDGGLKEDFLHVAGLVQVLVGNGTMRPFILVGIENTQRRRDLTGPTTNEKDKQIAPKVGGSAAYRQFIREEMMPQVKQRYRTTAETAIVGESLAGLFVVETLLLEPALFNTYLAFDPSLWWNNGQLAAQAGATLQKMRPAATVYLATSIHGDSVATRRLVELARPQAARLGAWHYEAMPQETHATIYHPAALRAFRAVFAPPAAGAKH